MISYALQWTTFIMQNVENYNKIWSFGGKGEEKSKSKKSLKHFMRNADKLKYLVGFF